MINFRYHIVSLTAVFLALIIGILMGTTVVSKATVDGLKANLHRAEARSQAVHETNRDLSGRLKHRADTDAEVDDALTDNVLAHAVDGSLERVPVLIVATDSVDKDVLEQSVTSLKDAGADLDGTLVLDDRTVLSDADAARVRQLLGVSPQTNAQPALIRQLTIALGQAALPGKSIPGATTTTTSTTSTTAPGGEGPTETTGPEATTTTTLAPPTEPDVIDELRRIGLLKFRPVDGGSNDAPVLEAPELADGTGYRYVFLAGPDADEVANTVMAPLIASLARLGDVAQVAGTGPKDPEDPGSDPFLGPLLNRNGVKGHVSTVDDLATFHGNVALAYALADAGEGHFGTYGIGDTADAVVPAYRRPSR